MKTTNMKTIGLGLLILVATSCYSPRNPHRLPLPVEFTIGMSKNEFVQKNDKRAYHVVRADEYETVYYARTGKIYDSKPDMYLFFVKDTLRAADVQLQEPKQVIEIRKVNSTN